MAGIRPQTILEGSSIAQWRSEARDGRQNTTGMPRKGGDAKRSAGIHGANMLVCAFDSQNLR
jgi:hypothetical protein